MFVVLHSRQVLVADGALCVVACLPMCLQVREIWLSSEDTGAYGRDIGASLPALLRSLVEVLPPGGW